MLPEEEEEVETKKQRKKMAARSTAKVLPVLPEDQDLIPSTHKVAYHCNSSSRGSNTLTHTYMQSKHNAINKSLNTKHNKNK